MSEEKLVKPPIGVIFTIVIVFAGFAIGLMVASRPPVAQVSTNETYLYNLGYSNGWNAGILTHPPSSDTSVTESEVMSQIMEALGTADKIDLQVHGDKVTGKANISLNIEFTQPTK